MESESSSLSLAGLAGVIRRQRVAFAAILIIALLCGVAAIKLVSPVYRSTTEILLEGRTQNDPGGPSQDIISEVSLPNEDVSLATQIEVLESNKILLSAFTAAGVPLPRQDVEIEDTSLPVIRVDQLGATNALRISVDSTDPQLALKLAGTLPDVYLRYLRDTRQEQVDHALTFLKDRSQAGQQALQQAIAKLTAFKKARTLLPLSEEGVQRSHDAQQQADDLVRASSAYAAAQERLVALKESRANLPKTKSFTEVSVNSDQIAKEQDEIAKLESQRDALLATYLKNSPKVLEVQNQIDADKAYLKRIPKVRDVSSQNTPQDQLSLDQKIADARAEVASTKAAFERISAAKATADDSLRKWSQIEPQQTALERDIESKKLEVTEVNKEINDLQLRRNSVKDPLKPLRAPTAPSQIKPQATLYLLLSLILGLIVASGFSLTRDALQDRLVNVDEVFALTGVPVLGEAGGGVSRGSDLAKISEDETVLDNFRLIGFRLAEIASETDLKSLVVTSPGHTDGKVQFCCNLATAAARDGLQVIVVDGNLRAPTIDKRLGVSNDVGLSDVLLKRVTLEEAIQPTATAGLRALTTGHTTASPSSLYTLATLPDLIRNLESLADLIIINAPSGEGNLETQILGRSADAVLLVARAGITKRVNLRKTSDVLRSASCNVMASHFSKSKNICTIQSLFSRPLEELKRGSCQFGKKDFLTGSFSSHSHSTSREDLLAQEA